MSTTEKSSGRLTLTCLSCGRVFKATDTDTTPQKIVEKPLTPSAYEVDFKPAAAITDLNLLNRQIVEVARSSGKLSAIKYCKDITGWSLDRCKKHVDELVDKGQVNEWYAAEPADTVAPASGLDQEIIEIARTKGKLHAVKHYKDRSGKGLKESVEYIERIVPAGVFKKTEGCFIATACYGDYEAREVIVLRHYRDDVLKRTAVGCLLVRFYYYVSPPLANYIHNKPRIRSSIRQHLLQPLVSRLSRKS